MDKPLPANLNPDDKPIYDALREAGAEEGSAYTAVQRIREVASANLIAQVLSRLDAQNALIAAQNTQIDALIAAQSAKLDAQDSKLRMLMWMVGAAVAIIGILVRLWG